ncbi:Arm DNA-binding domain-containing protein, partial [uncultured Alistipes sp.]
LTSPLCLLFFHDNRKKSVGLGISAAREYWDAEEQKLKDGCPNRDGCGQLPANVPSARRRCNG